MEKNFKFLKGLATGVIISGVAAWWWNTERGQEFYIRIRPKIRKAKAILQDWISAMQESRDN